MEKRSRVMEAPKPNSGTWNTERAGTMMRKLSKGQERKHTDGFIKTNKKWLRG